MDFTALTALLKNYGPWSLVLLVLIYIVLNSEFTFKFPRQEEDKQEEDLKKGTSWKRLLQIKK
jgi:hypothetical protein